MPADAPLDERAWRYLADHRVAHLATTDADGRPSLVPICYADDGRAIYSALDQKPKRVAPAALQRVRNLRAHPEVALLVDDRGAARSRVDGHDSAPTSAICAAE